jgi:MoaD family protein
MIEVRIQFLSFIEDLVGKKEEIIRLEENSTLSDLLNEIKKLFDRDLTKLIFSSSGDLKKYILIGLNGQSAKEFAIQLNQGDEISILPAIAGG